MSFVFVVVVLTFLVWLFVTSRPTKPILKNTPSKFLVTAFGFSLLAFGLIGFHRDAGSGCADDRSKWGWLAFNGMFLFGGLALAIWAGSRIKSKATSEKSKNIATSMTIGLVITITIILWFITSFWLYFCF